MHMFHGVEEAGGQLRFRRVGYLFGSSHRNMYRSDTSLGIIIARDCVIIAGSRYHDERFVSHRVQACVGVSSYTAAAIPHLCGN